jgi:hypothetical protein
VILATWETEIQRMAVQGQPAQIVHETISKITRARWTRGMAQVVEYLKCKALSSNPRPTPIKFYL